MVNHDDRVGHILGCRRAGGVVPASAGKSVAPHAGRAARARQVSHIVPPEDRKLLVAAAWLHDIGYAPELRVTSFHPLDGVGYLESLGAPPQLVRLVAHHSGAVYEAGQRGMSADLAAYEREDSPLLDALIYADMTTVRGGSASPSSSDWTRSSCAMSLAARFTAR